MHAEQRQTGNNNTNIRNVFYEYWYFMAGGSTLLAIFPDIPPRHNQSFIYHKLDKINSIRNRVAHHEPICFDTGNQISTTYARLHFQEIVDVLKYMNVNSQQLFYGVDGIIKEANYIDML